MAGDLAELPADPKASASRRDRRLAEVETSAGSAQLPGEPILSRSADAAVTADASHTSSAGTAHSVDPASPPRRKSKRFLSFLKGLFYLTLISTLIVGLGTVIAGEENTVAGPTQTELHRQAAWKTTTTLAAQTTALVASPLPTHVQPLLKQAAKDLGIQAAALGDGLPHNTTARSDASTGDTTPTTITALTKALGRNGEGLLSHALTAENAMGRVFAAVGTSQLLLARDLSAAVGAVPPVSAFLANRAAVPSPVGPQCSSTLEPRPGTTIDSALRTAAVGEQKAIYAYQISTTRMTEPRVSKSAALLALHQEKLAVLTDELQLRCLPGAAPVAGFALDPVFISDPQKGLAGLEGELAGMYANLAALSAPVSTETVANSVPANTSVPARAAPPSATAMPDAVATGAAAASGTLREISVLWLLDSAQTQDFWGGSVGALAGMPK